MKKVIALILLTMSAAAVAQHNHHRHGHHGHYRHHNGGWVWVVPAIIGGAVVYGATRPDPVIVQQPVVIQQQTQNCSPWMEVQNVDGTITRSRTCSQ